MVELVASAHPGPVRILEIGCWAGVSALSWAAAVHAAGRELNLTCVDFWRQYFDASVDAESVYRQMNAAHQNDLVFQLFRHNLRAAGILSRTDIRHGEARDVLPTLPDGCFDIIYIDGGHRLEDVRFDIEQARRLVRLGGAICGDDLEIASANGLGDEHSRLLSAGRDYAYLPAQGQWYHPGVTEAVTLCLGEVFAWNGFWAVCMSENGPSVPVLDVADSPLPSHIESSRDAEKAEELPGIGNWRLFRLADRVVATSEPSIATILDALDVGQIGNWPGLVVAPSIDEAVALVHAAQSAAAGGATQRAPELLGEFQGYNLVRTSDGYLALSLAIGRVTIDADGETIVRRHGLGNAFFAPTLTDLLMRIEVKSISASMAALSAALASDAREARAAMSSLAAGQLELAQKIGTQGKDIREAAVALQRALNRALKTTTE